MLTLHEGHVQITSDWEDDGDGQDELGDAAANADDEDAAAPHAALDGTAADDDAHAAADGTAIATRGLPTAGKALIVTSSATNSLSHLLTRAQHGPSNALAR